MKISIPFRLPFRYQIEKQLIIAALLMLGFSASTTAAVEAPQVTVTDNTLYWTSVDAISINVHRENGEWLESIPGSDTQWQATDSGSYFLVSTDSGPWQEWGRSNIVSVNTAQNDELNSDFQNSLIIDNYYAQVYSPTSAELFWELPNSSVVEVEVFRDDGESLDATFTSGRSFYQSDLQPGKTYHYSLFPYDDRGNIGDEVYIEITTASADGPGSANPATPQANSVGPTAPDETTASDRTTGLVEDTRTDSFSIDGNTISFEADGWFQVQSRDARFNYETLCEGQSSCTVEEGSYQITNHSTGEVWQNVLVDRPSVRWAQTRITTALVSWTSVIYNDESYIDYDIEMNGELVTTATQNNVLVSGFARGTNYNVSVYGNLADGSTELVGEIDVLTEGPDMAVVTYGKPAEDRDTFGFEQWDRISPDNRALFPSDCLFAMPSGGFCFSPATRFLIAGYNRVDWEYQLPGDNSTNHIEALVHFYGSGGRRGAPKRFALVTDVTTTFAQSMYEISVFGGSVGEFLGTFPILDTIRNSSDAGVDRQINLDGADLQVTVGPVRPNPSMFVASFPRRLHIVGEYYEPNGSGDLSDVSGWARQGAFFAEVDADTGETLSETLYPGLTMDEVPVD